MARPDRFFADAGVESFERRPQLRDQHHIGSRFPAQRGVGRADLLVEAIGGGIAEFIEQGNGGLLDQGVLGEVGVGHDAASSRTGATSSTSISRSPR